MHVDVIASVNEARSDDFIHKTAIVIDVLRATSTIITALSHGCKEVLPVETVQQARTCQLPGDWLGGERFCKKIAGFHAGNSPYEYMDEVIRDKKVVLTTTNGTRAIQKSTKATHILAGAFINASVCAGIALSLRKDIVLLCAGAQDVFALEDGLCAGLFVEELIQQNDLAPPLQVNDFGLAMHSAYLQHKDNLVHTLMNCAGGRKLSKIGFAEDVEYCAGMNTVPVVPFVNDQQSMKLFPVTPTLLIRS
ncbi:2-phosphosulfolactate phosphatase [Paenibacillus selenitireducens]|uniref:Probable 2-phosphosulfolactate phosphatase n=1 Tax=Paenibacillus selenitireducens TaxID=1324314 RepID=A0A1T2XND5_9BACL|nr:2-phosphosulfolactate phosphatase [Paenibacillus selenitireducens]OPA81328.1 2-phosphosulfolactate phosphatase [Paenibacillus selenitireducens]